MPDNDIQTQLVGNDLAKAIKSAIAAELKLADNMDAPGGTPELDWELVSNNKLDEKKLIAIYSQVSGIPILDEQETRDIIAFPDVSYDFLNSQSCLPVSWTDDNAVIAIISPYPAANLQHLWESIYNIKPSFLIARRAFIERFITSLYDKQDENEGNIFDSDSEQALRDLAKEAPIVRLVSDIFNRAQELGASDIHIEPTETEVAVRFRIDGLLQTVLRPPKNQYAAIASRIKLLAGMNIAERRLPQDGRIELNTPGNPLDIRVSTVPCMHGESIVLRLLQKDQGVFDLDKVGLLDDTRKELETLFNMPHGMILVVGPTGSGKSTTLYCIMRILNADYRKIITIDLQS